MRPNKVRQLMSASRGVLGQRHPPSLGSEALRLATALRGLPCLVNGQLAIEGREKTGNDVARLGGHR